MSKYLRVVHYLNQFFGGGGLESKAYLGPEVKGGPIGPGKALQEALGTKGEVVATVICGDNYFVERMEEALEEVIQLLAPYKPDVVIAGPAFEAGRYGIACGRLCKGIQDRLGVLAVTGMYKENPGVDLFRKEVYIVQTEDSVKGMSNAIVKMVDIASKLAANQKMGKPSEDGYFARGFITNEPVKETAAERVVSLLLTKLQGRPFVSEVPLPKFDRVRPATGIKDLGSATIALVTDGGLVPKGNPDKIEVRRATRLGSYDIESRSALVPGEYEVSHSGYDSLFVIEDPHRLVPLDIMRDLEKEGVIGKVYGRMFSTSGAVCILENIRKMGKTIASELKNNGVSGVILTST